MEDRMFTLPEAARAADLPEDELLVAIRDGLLLAQVRQNTGQWAVSYAELAAYLKRSRRMELKSWARKKKVLLLGEDLLLAGTLKLDLQRDPRLDVKFASWGKDAVMMVHHYNADLIVVDLAPSRVPPDEVLAAVARRDRPLTCPVLATAPRSREILKLQPLVHGRLEALAPDVFVPATAGTQVMVNKVWELLGIPARRTGARRKQA